MSASPLTRRAALAALGALAIPAAVPVRRASAQPGVRFRNIVVDVSPLRPGKLLLHPSGGRIAGAGAQRRHVDHDVAESDAGLRVRTLDGEG